MRTQQGVPHMIRSRLCIALVAILAFVLTACGGGGSSPSGPTEIAVWHGYQDTEGEVFKGLIDQYNKDHPDVKVSELYSSNDLVLQKVLTAVRGGSAPDVAYMFGSWSPNIAQIPQVVDMADEVQEPGLEVGRLLPGRAGGGDGRRQGRRRARPGGQSRDRLQQEAVRRRRCRTADDGLDVGRLPRRRRQADRSDARGSTAG